MQRFGEFRLDLQNECVWNGAEQLSLTPRPFSVLRYLVENPQRLVTHDELLEALWPETYVQPQVLRTYVLELRKLLGDDHAAPRFIQTIPKRGYRFVAAVTHSATDVSGESAPMLFGRERELKTLAQGLKRAEMGERHSVFISGEVGIGKTTLIDAFCAQQVEPGKLRMARGQCIEGFGGKEAFYPVREALSSLCSAEDEKASSLLAAAAPGWFRHAGGLPPSLHEICEALEALSQSQTLMVVFEDIHDADASTLDLISALARRRSRARLLLVSSFRPADVDVKHPLRRLEQDLLTSRHSESLRLGPLDKEAVGGYLRREFQAERLAAGLVSLIHQHSAGNALFMTAAVDHLRARGILRSEGGAVYTSMPLEEIDFGVPSGLATMIGLQLERLTAEDRLLLEAGSIAGAIFPSWAAAAALARSVDEVEEAYATLVRHVRLLAVAGQDELPGGIRSTFYVFAHALYRDALYAALPAARRAQWHLRIADRLREMFAGQEANVAHEIASHLQAGAAIAR
jgi:predicted ATPase